jgi:hypothetical protein
MPLVQRDGELEERLQALRDEHSATLRDLTSSHESALEQVTKERDSALESLRSEHTAVLSQQQAAHEAALDKIRSSHEKALSESSHQAEALAHELGELKVSLTGLESDRDVAAKRCEDLESRLSRSAEEHRAETVKLQDELAQALEQARAVSARDDSDAGKAEELQEALDSISTLENELVRAQDERDRALSELETLRSEQEGHVSKSMHASAVKDLENQRDKAVGMVEEARQERDVLKAERNKQEAALRDSNQSGFGINGVPSGLTRSMSQSSEHGDSVEGSVRSSPPLSHAPVLRQLATTAANLNGAGGKQAPPPTPPPSMPPPPLPASAASGGVPASTKPNGVTRTSSSSSMRRGSSEATSPPTSYGMRSSVNSMTDVASIDAKVQQRLEEQESQVRTARGTQAFFRATHSPES